MTTAKVELTQPLKQQRQFVAHTACGARVETDQARPPQAFTPARICHVVAGYEIDVRTGVQG